MKHFCEICGTQAPESTVVAEGCYCLCPTCEVSAKLLANMTHELGKVLRIEEVKDPEERLGYAVAALKKHYPQSRCECCHEPIQHGAELCQICASMLNCVSEVKTVSIPDHALINPEDLR